MKLNKESKTILPLPLIIFVMILLTSGLKKGLIAVSAFLFCGATMIASIWLIAFIIACILFGSIREAWIEMNPLALIKELWF
jgi:hypothetical protein